MNNFTIRKPKSTRKFSNYGISSIVTILTIMCVLSFTILTYITSKYDYQLSYKITKKNSNYYKARCLANEELEKIDDVLFKCYSNCNSESEYYTNAFNELQKFSGQFYTNLKNKLTIQSSAGTSFYFEFSTKISKSRKLETIIYIKYPFNSNDVFFQIKGWNEKVEINEPIDDTLNVYTGD